MRSAPLPDVWPAAVPCAPASDTAHADTTPLPLHERRAMAYADPAVVAEVVEAARGARVAQVADVAVARHDIEPTVPASLDYEPTMPLPLLEYEATMALPLLAEIAEEPEEAGEPRLNVPPPRIRLVL